MKKNKLIVSVTTTKIYEYNTTAETSDVALDEFYNDSSKRLKLVCVQGSNYEIQQFIEAKSERITKIKPTKGKK